MTQTGSTFRTAEPGLSELLEAIHAGKVQLPDFQRGWVWDDNHIKSLIASISRFSKNTQEAAFAGGAAPITLIDGDKLIDLLIQHGIGVRKKTVEVSEVVAEDFAMAEEGE